MNKTNQPQTTSQSNELDAPERETRELETYESGLFAEIKKTSEYYGSQGGGDPFPVNLYADGEYIVHGGPGGRYRLSDVDLYWANNAGLFFKIKK